MNMKCARLFSFGHVFLGTAVMACLVLMHLVFPALADESITVSCYRDNRAIGTVAVFDMATAAAACNRTYYDCRGQCIACVFDNDFVDDVCTDASGRTFLR